VNVTCVASLRGAEFSYTGPAGSVTRDCVDPVDNGNRTKLCFLIMDESPIYSVLMHRHRGDRLCGLMVRVLPYRCGGPGSIPGTTKKNLLGLERGPLSPVSTTEELLDRKVAAPV
jgi:hypothetical protein